MQAIGVIAVIVVVGLGYYLMSSGSSSGGLGEILSGGNLSASQIQTYASNAGFDGDDLAIAVAIAQAESSGNPKALNSSDPQGSYGLWQINLAAHPEYSSDPTQLYDPQTNANAAYAVYTNANGFSPWSTYNNGAYQSYLQTPSTQDTSTVASNVDDYSDDEDDTDA